MSEEAPDTMSLTFREAMLLTTLPIAAVVVLAAVSAYFWLMG